MSARSMYPLVAVLGTVKTDFQLNKVERREMEKRAKKGSKQHRIEGMLSSIGMSWHQYQYLYGRWLRKGGEAMDFLLAIVLSFYSVGIIIGGGFLTIFYDIHLSEESGRLYWELKKDEIGKSFLFIKQIDAICKDVHLLNCGYEKNVSHSEIEIPDDEELLDEWVFEGAKKEGVLVGYSKLDRQLRKWDFGNVKKTIIPRNIVGEKWADLITRYVKMAPKEIRSFLVRVFRTLFPPDCRIAYHEKAILNTFKMLSTRLKKEVPHCISGLAGYLIDLGQLGGYSTVDNLGVQLFNDWSKSMSNATDRFNQVRNSTIYKGLLNQIRKTVREWGVNSSRIVYPVSFDQFVQDRGNWAISGSSTLPKRKVKVKSVDRVNGYRTHVIDMATKETTAMFYSDDELVRYSLDSTRGKVSYPFRKGDEPAKARVVVNHAIESYLRVSFLNHYIARSPDYTTLEKGTRGTHEMYLRMQDLLRSGCWGISLDYSGWDTSVFVSLVEEVVDAFGELISERLYSEESTTHTIIAEEIKKITDLEKDSLRNMWYKLPTGEMVWGGSGFLSSGYKWTAVANTIINKALFDFTTRCIGDRKVQFSAHQGDDVAVLYRAVDQVDANDFVTRFSNFVGKLGFSINPSKTSIDQNGVEFLRLWVTTSGVWGYPGRMARTFFWSKPQDTGGEYQSWLNRILEVVENGKIAIRRGLSDVGSVVRKIVCKYIPSGLTVSERSKLIHWLSCAENRGGMGAPGFWDAQNVKYCMWYPELKSDSSVYLPRDVLTQLGGGLDTKTGGILAIRLRSLLTDNIPMRGVQRKLVFIRRPGLNKTSDVYRKVHQVLNSGRPNISIPMAWPTVEDGPGWWAGGIIGQDLLRNSKRGDDSWVFYLADRFKDVLEQYRVRPTRGLVNWGESNRQPPPVNKKPEELSQWKERLVGEERWNLVFAFGILHASPDERKLIETGLKGFM